MYYYEDDFRDVEERIHYLEDRIDKIGNKLFGTNNDTVYALMATVMRLADLKKDVEDLKDQVYRSDLKNRSFRKRKPNLVRGKIRTKNLKLKKHC